MPRLTKRTVDQATPTARQRVFLRDDELKGFGLVVLPSGVKSYFVEYRLPGGRSATKGRISIGKHGSPWTPELARREAAEILTQVRRGVDPRQSRKINTELSFDAYVEAFLARSQSLRSIKHMAMVFRVHVTPVFRNTQIGSISRSAIAKLVSDVAAKSPATGRYVHAILGRLFRTAVSRGDIASSPMQDMEPPPLVPSRDRVLSDAEIAKLWIATYGLSELAGAAIRLLILTGQRRSEVFGMSTEELDLETNFWTIPARRAKNNIAHVVPLSSSVLAELGKLGVNSGRSGLIFTTTGTTPISGISKTKTKMDDLLDGVPPWRLHDIRRTVATGLQRLGTRFEVTEAILNHVSGAKSGVAGVYQRHDWATEKRNALEAWGRHVEKLVNEGTGQSNIIRLASALPMPRGGRRPGSGRPPSAQGVDAWIAQKVNELVLSTISPRGLQHIVKNDPILLDLQKSIRDEEAELQRLPATDREAVLNAIRSSLDGNHSALDALPERLRFRADDLLSSENEFKKQMFSGSWVKTGGNSVSPISSREWSKIYQKVAKLADGHFGRPFNQRQITEAMARKKRRFLQGPFFWSEYDKPT